MSLPQPTATPSPAYTSAYQSVVDARLAALATSSAWPPPYRAGKARHRFPHPATVGAPPEPVPDAGPAFRMLIDAADERWLWETAQTLGIPVEEVVRGVLREARALAELDGPAILRTPAVTQ